MILITIKPLVISYNDFGKLNQATFMVALDGIFQINLDVSKDLFGAYDDSIVCTFNPDKMSGAEMTPYGLNEWVQIKMRIKEMASVYFSALQNQPARFDCRL